MKKILCFIFILLPFAAGAVPPHPDLLRNFREEKKLLEYSERMSRDRALGKNTAYRAFPLTGTQKVLVLLIGFIDLPIEQSNPESYFSDLFNGATDEALSFNKYYKDMSNGALDIELDIFHVGNSAEGFSYYGEGDDINVRELVQEAVVLGNDVINYADYDNDNDGVVDTVFVIHAGAGEEVGPIGDEPATVYEDRIWSHKWQIDDFLTGDLNSMGLDVKVRSYTMQPEFVLQSGDSTIGVFVHEFGHVLGLPDLYDVGFYDEDNPQNFPDYSDGIGDWGVMSGGSWGGGDGSVPAPMTAWSRYQLDWIELEEITQDSALLYSGIKGNSFITLMLLVASLLTYILLKKKRNIRLFLPVLFLTLSLIACGRRGTDLPLTLADLDISNKAFAIPIDTNEYVILENKLRKAGTWSYSLPGSGLLLTHIDDNIMSDRYWSNSVNNYSLTQRLGVKVIEADGNDGLIDGYDRDYGKPTDTFYEGNVTELINYKSNQENDATFELINVNSVGSTINFQIFLFDQD